MASSSPRSFASTCLRKRSAWSTGSFSSPKALAYSWPQMNSSKRSVRLGSPAFFLASGDTSRGCSVTNVGWMSFSSATASKISAMSLPLPHASSAWPPLRSRMATSSSRVRAKLTSSLAPSLASSIMVARRHVPPRSTCAPWYSTCVVPHAASAAAWMTPCVSSIMPSRSLNAW